MSPISRHPLAKAATTLAVVGALVLAGCTSTTSTNTSSPKGPTSITVSNGTGGDFSKNFNPFSNTVNPGVLGLVYETLFVYNIVAKNTEDATKPNPMLGESIAWDDTGQVLTVKVRPGVKWSDGTAMTAKDVAFTYNYIVADKAINPSGLKGKATASDDTTVKLDFGAPQSYMLAPNFLGNTAIVPEAKWKDVSDPSSYINETPVATGPFTMGDFTPQSYILKKNPTYWDTGKPAIDEIRYVGFGSADAATTALLNGDVDWMSAFIPGLDQLLQGHEHLSYTNNHIGTTILGACVSTDLGCTGPQTDPAIRQAIYYALDRTNLNAAAFDNLAAQPSYTMMIPGRDDFWFAPEPDGLAPMTADVAKAEQILKDGGWAKGSDGIYAKDGKKASLTAQVVSGYADYIASLQSITEYLKAIGIELKMRQLSWNEWINNQNKGDFQLSMESIGTNVTPNPYYNYQLRFSSAQTEKVGTTATANWGRYTNKTVDAAVAAAGKTDDPEKQKVEYVKIQAELFNDMPYIPVVVSATTTEFNNSRATGWPTADNPYAFPAAWKAWDVGIVAKTIKPAG